MNVMRTVTVVILNKKFQFLLNGCRKNLLFSKVWAFHNPVGSFNKWIRKSNIFQGNFLFDIDMAAFDEIVNNEVIVFRPAVYDKLQIRIWIVGNIKILWIEFDFKLVSIAFFKLSRRIFRKGFERSYEPKFFWNNYQLLYKYKTSHYQKFWFE